MQAFPGSVKQGAVRIALDEGFEFPDGFARFGLVALRPTHLAEVGEAKFVLRVVGAAVGRVEREELPELVESQDKSFVRAFSQIGIADAELRIWPIRALRTGLNDLFEELPRLQPLLGIECLRAPVEQVLVRLHRALRHEPFGSRSTCRRGNHEEQDDHRPHPSGEATRCHHSIPLSHAYSAASPFSRSIDGTKPSSARARLVSA